MHLKKYSWYWDTVYVYVRSDISFDDWISQKCMYIHLEERGRFAGYKIAVNFFTRFEAWQHFSEMFFRTCVPVRLVNSVISRNLDAKTWLICTFSFSLGQNKPDKRGASFWCVTYVVKSQPIAI